MCKQQRWLDVGMHCQKITLQSQRGNSCQAHEQVEGGGFPTVEYNSPSHAAHFVEEGGSN